MRNNEKIIRIHLGFVNAYLVRAGEGFILVDTGLRSHLPKLEAALKEAGVLPDKLKLIILTHGDTDHIGCAGELRSRHGCRIAMHPADVPMVEQGLSPKREAAGFPWNIMMLLVKLSRGILKLVAPNSQKHYFKPDMPLADGESLSRLGVDAKIVHLPGHTAGSLAIVFPDGDIISGDTLVDQGGPGTARIIENREGLKASIEKLKNLRLNTVYPGHGNPFPASLILK